MGDIKISTQIDKVGEASVSISNISYKGIPLDSSVLIAGSKLAVIKTQDVSNFIKELNDVINKYTLHYD